MDPVARLARDLRACAICRRDLIATIDRAKEAIDAAIFGAPQDASDEAIVVEAIAAARVAGLCAEHVGRYVRILIQACRDEVC